MASRGQADAPIELLVAVIILAMSMSLAFYVINTSGEAQCIAEMRSQVRALESAMVDVAIGSPPTSRQAAFSMKSCGTKKIEGLRFVKYTTSAFCTACSGYTSGCWKIEPVYVDSVDGRLKPLDDASLCVEMPMDVGVEDEYNPSAETGMGGVSKCTALVDKPCPAELQAEGKCKYDPSFTKVMGSQYWRTLGRAGGESYFVIKLTKRIYLGGLSGTAGQKGYIGVCALTKAKAG